LFIESLVEKDQEIAYLRFDLQEAQRNSFVAENNYENLKVELRSQALELEEKEDVYKKNLEDIKKEMEDNNIQNLIEEIRKNEDKDRDFFNQYRLMEEKMRSFESKVTEKDQEIEDLLKENGKTLMEREKLFEKIKNLEENVEILEIKIKNKKIEDNIKENDFLNQINIINEQNSQLEKNLIEANKKVMFLETKTQLCILKNEKKKKKIGDEREKSTEMLNSYKDEMNKLHKTYEEKENDWLNEQTLLRNEIKILKEEKSVQLFRRRKKQNSLKDEFQVMNTPPEKIDLNDPKTFFERIGGRAICKNKFVEFDEILERIKRENDEFIDDFEPYVEDLKKIIKGLEREMEDLKKDNNEINKEKEKFHNDYLEMMKKLEPKPEKQKENHAYLGFGLIPFLRR